MRTRSQDVVIAERAAHWLAALPKMDATQRADFLKWMKQSPLHVREVLLATALELELKGIGRHIDVDTLLSAAARNVVPLAANTASAAEGAALREEDKAQAGLRTEARSPWKRWTVRLAIAAAAAFVLVAGLLFHLTGSRVSYETRVGEQRSVSLSDGSVLSLDTLSRVEVRYTANSRDIYLRKGQALFNVAHEPVRAFRVHADYAQIEAVGTLFDVRVLTDRTKVAVLEGAIQVWQNEGKVSLPVRSTQPPLRLVAGEGANIYAIGKIERQAKISKSDVTAWRQGRLVFHNVALQDIASEFNRYNKTKLVVLGEELGRKRYTGSFKADDLESFIRYLSLDKGLRFERNVDDTTTISIANRQVPVVVPPALQ